MRVHKVNNSLRVAAQCDYYTPIWPEKQGIMGT